MTRNSPGSDSAHNGLQDQDSTNLSGMNAAEAKEYIFGFISLLKQTEKEIRALEDEAAKWKGRADLARSHAKLDLLAEAERELERAKSKIIGLREEAQALKERIDSMRRQLPALAARQRAIDPDIIEQEILMAVGLTREEIETEKAFQRMEKERSADAALQDLKARMKA
ncbi:MAG: chromosome partitioning protein [Treponema sp.]|nr:chromosome partitioning protein [Treponema sp.]